MDKGWIKLFRRINSHSLATDMIALGVFTWILTNANTKTGKLLVGRYATSKQLGLAPTTFRDILKRLEKKHRVLTTGVTPGKHTEISVSNWAKYQAPQQGDATSNATQTPRLKNTVSNSNINTNTLSVLIDSGVELKNSSSNTLTQTPKLTPYQVAFNKKLTAAGLPPIQDFTSEASYIMSLSARESMIYATVRSEL